MGLWSCKAVKLSTVFGRKADSSVSHLQSQQWSYPGLPWQAVPFVGVDDITVARGLDPPQQCLRSYHHTLYTLEDWIPKRALRCCHDESRLDPPEDNLMIKATLPEYTRVCLELPPDLVGCEHVLDASRDSCSSSCSCFTRLYSTRRLNAISSEHTPTSGWTWRGLSTACGMTRTRISVT